MANNIIIRKASKDHVCDVCGRIIKAGDEYLDRVILDNGKCVRHERYHDECPRASSAEKLFSLIEKNKGDLIIANKEGIKIRVIGISYGGDGEPMILYREWEDFEYKTIKLSELKNYHDCNGNNLI